MERRALAVVGFLIATGFALITEGQELETKYPLLSRLDIPADSLPKGCSKPDLQPDDFPIKGLRQCAITTDLRAIAALDEEATKVGAKNIEALYYGIYKEAGELFVIGWAFSNPRVAKDAYRTVDRRDNCFKAWLSGKYLITLWHETGTTNTCLQRLSLAIEDMVSSVRKEKSRGIAAGPETGAGVAPAEPHGGEQVPTVRIPRGELSVVFRDNSQSPRVLSGIDSLFNIKHAADYDAYDPDVPRASAGLNFEHIISGHRNPNNKFTPRHGKFTLHKLPDSRSATLVRRAADSPWQIASTLKYAVIEPYYVDFEFRCTPRDASLFGRRGYAVFFFANYMNDVQDVSLHFRGHASADGPEKWISANAPKAHADWNGGGNYRALSADDLEYDNDVQFRLNTWSYDWPRIAKPFYYGRASRGMSLILMFDRLHSDRDQIRFSLYKFKLPKRPRPAWDFQYVINKVVTGSEYGFRGRLVWKKFISAEDCLKEYQQWTAALEAARARLRSERVQRLRQLGATVFARDQHVVEVNGNRTKLRDQDLEFLSEFTKITDLSLEETRIGDAGLRHLHRLQKLEWLNLYRSQIGDQGLREVARLQSLQHLPIGATRVTDAGLVYLSEMKQLVYLGLRGNDVTDHGIKRLRELVNLTGLHLGGTGVTDAGLMHLLGMDKLQNLWLYETAVSDRAISTLAKLQSLRKLYIADTKITPAGVKRLAALLPRCRIVDQSP